MMKTKTAWLDQLHCNLLDRALLSVIYICRYADKKALHVMDTHVWTACVMQSYLYMYSRQDRSDLSKSPRNKSGVVIALFSRLHSLCKLLTA